MSAVLHLPSSLRRVSAVNQAWRAPGSLRPPVFQESRCRACLGKHQLHTCGRTTGFRPLRKPSKSSMKSSINRRADGPHRAGETELQRAIRASLLECGPEHARFNRASPSGEDHRSRSPTEGLRGQAGLSGSPDKFVAGGACDGTPSPLAPLLRRRTPQRWFASAATPPPPTPPPAPGTTRIHTTKRPIQGERPRARAAPGISIDLLIV